MKFQDTGDMDVSIGECCKRLCWSCSGLLIEYSYSPFACTHAWPCVSEELVMVIFVCIEGNSIRYDCAWPSINVARCYKSSSLQLKIRFHALLTKTLSKLMIAAPVLHVCELLMALCMLSCRVN